MSSTTDMTKRNELITVAEAMVEEKMNLIEGVRKIAALRHHIENADDAMFMPIRAIESETDHFAIGAARAGYDPDYLKRLDEDMARYLLDAKQDILNACRGIVERYSRSA